MPTALPDAPHPRAVRVTFTQPDKNQGFALVRRITPTIARVVFLSLHPEADGSTAPQGYVELPAPPGIGLTCEVLAQLATQEQIVAKRPPEVRRRQKLPGLTMSDKAREILDRLCRERELSRGELVEQLLFAEARRGGRR